MMQKTNQMFLGAFIVSETEEGLNAEWSWVWINIIRLNQYKAVGEIK